MSDELPEDFEFDPSSLTLDEAEALEDRFGVDYDALVGALDRSNPAPFGLDPDGVPVRLTIDGRTVRRAGVLRALAVTLLARSMSIEDADRVAGGLDLRQLGASGKAKRGAGPAGSGGSS